MTSLPTNLTGLVENANFSSAQCYSPLTQNGWQWPPKELADWPHGYTCVTKTVSEYTQGDIFPDENYACGSKVCQCCWKLMDPDDETTTTSPPIDNSCEDVNDQCKTRMQGLGECVNTTSVDDWSSLSIKYDQWGDSYSNQFCRPSNGGLIQKDCCRCMKKRPCRDGGCYENGGRCVDMKAAHIYLNYHGATHHGAASRSLLGRSLKPFFTTDNGQVDLSNRIDGDGLCQSEDPKQRSCCECYQRVSNRTSGNFNLFQLFTQLRTYGTSCLRSN